MDNWACPIIDSSASTASGLGEQGLFVQLVDIEFTGDLEFGFSICHGGWAFLDLRLLNSEPTFCRT